jgi:hypothetical protein
MMTARKVKTKVADGSTNAHLTRSYAWSEAEALPMNVLGQILVGLARQPQPG